MVNAIIRGLFAANKISVAQANPHGAELPRLLCHLIDTGQAHHKTVLLHTHSWTAECARILAGFPHCVAFANYRDPRDVCVSLMRLHDHDLEVASRMTVEAFDIFTACVRDIQPMVLPYHHLVADPPGHIYQIGRHLRFWPSQAQVAQIAQDTSKDRHRAVMEQVQAGTMDGLARRQNTNRVLVEDPRTLINDRHIQSGQSGRWRAELSADQKEVANERFRGILTRYGFSD